MANDTASRGYLVLLALVSMLIVCQSLAIGRDSNSFERPMLSVATTFKTPEGPQPDIEAPLELAPTNFEPGALSTLPGEEDELEPGRVGTEPPVIQTVTEEHPVLQEPSDDGPEAIGADETGDSTEEMAPADENPERASATPTAQPAPEAAVHVVTTGDSLWSLSRRYGVTIEQLATWNDLSSKRNIRPGQRLVVRPAPAPVLSPQALAPAPVAPAVPRTEPSQHHAVTYTVQTGDSLYLIAKKFRTSVASLLLNNNIVDPERLQLGQVLNVTTANRISHVVNRGETLWELSRLYSIPLSDLIEHNDLQFRTIFPGQRLSIPVRDPRTLQTLFDKEQKPAYTRPLRGRLCGYFGWRIHPILKRRLFHCGVDLAARTGTSIGAIAPGRVTFAGWLRGYGNVVVVKHGHGVSSRYAHCKSIDVEVGHQVRAGQKLAVVGSTGLATGPHLHLEVRKNGRPVDPRDYVAI